MRFIRSKELELNEFIFVIVYPGPSGYIPLYFLTPIGADVTGLSTVALHVCTVESGETIKHFEIILKTF